MNESLLNRMRQSIIDGMPETAGNLARQALALGLDPLDLINTGYVAGLTYVGEKYGCGEVFLPDLMMAAEAMKSALTVLEPELRQRGAQRAVLGRVVLGTARGDIHDIGKNLVATVLAAGGFQVFDLGTNVTPEQFVAKSLEVEADVVGVSALLTTTMLGQKAIIEEFDRRALRPKVKVIVGGAAVSRKWAAEICADGYAPSCMDALALVKRLLGKAEAALKTEKP